MKKLLLLLCGIGMVSFAQARAITGTAKTPSGDPLPGATVLVEGTTIGTTTDLDGKFTIDASTGNKLVLSFIGYQTVTKDVGSASNVEVVMSEDSQMMDDVVVIGYGTQRRSDISTAVASVNMAEVEKSGTSQVLLSMQGKVSGVQISANDGSPAGGMTFKVRGTNSLTGGTQPLFVIDGVPQPISADPEVQATNNPLSYLSTNDIEAIEVLKDASASAIYGADGSNGVVLITTKRGTQGKAKVNVSYSYGINHCPDSELQTLSPKEYTEMQLYRAEQGQSIDVEKWQDILDTGKYDDPAYAHDWMDEIMQASDKHELNASMSGGNDKTLYMLSMGYLDNDGLLLNSGFKRFTSRLNLSQKFGKKVTVSANLAYSNTDEANPITDWSQNGVFIKAMTTNPFLGYAAADDTVTDDWMSQSPTVYVEERDLHKIADDISGKLQLEYKIINGLTFNTSYSLRKNNQKYTSYWGPNTWYGSSEQGRMEFYYNDQINWVYEARFNYNKNIGKHNFGAMVAYEAKNQETNHFYSKTTNFEDVTLGIYGVNGGLVPFSPSYTFDDNSTQSLIARANYSYDNRYIFTASVRRDGSSKFGSNNKYGVFPAMSAAWRLDQERWMKDVNWVSGLKARASYGVTGNNQFPSYQALSLLGSGKVSFDDGTIEQSKFSYNIANEDLSWESSKQFNVGFDFAVLKNRLSFTTDYYYKKISDMLMEVNLPATSGYDKAWKNAGSMMNEGLEFSLNAVVIDRAFRWTSDFNISFNRNEILSLDEGQNTRYYTRQFSNDVILQVGQPVGTYFGYVKDGIYNSEAEVLNSPTDAMAAVGRSKLDFLTLPRE